MITDISKRFELLKPFGRIPSGTDVPVFGDIGNVIAARVRKDYYHPEPLNMETCIIPEDLKIDSFLKTPEYQRGYIYFKYCLAKVLKIKNVVEIGLGAGNSATAFALAMHGTRGAFYFGIDILQKEKEQKINYSQWTKEYIEGLNVKFSLLEVDSLSLKNVPVDNIDLFHVDGAHDYVHALNDCILAFKMRPNYVLVDDSHDPIVLKAAIEAYHSVEGYVPVFFEDTFTGNLLFIKTGG